MTIGGSAGASVTLCADGARIRLVFPIVGGSTESQGREDPYDWVPLLLELHAHGFSGATSLQVERLRLATWATDLSAFIALRSDSVGLTLLDEDLVIDLRRGPLGDVKVEFDLRVEQRVRFHFSADTDAARVEMALSDLDACLAKLGTPS